MSAVRKPYQRVTHAPPNAASRCGLARAMAELSSDTRITDREAMAEREQLHRDADARMRRQGEFRLISRGRG